MKGNVLPPGQQADLLTLLAARFAAHMPRHKKQSWGAVEKRLRANTPALWTLHEMERTGGEPDVVGGIGAAGHYRFVDCSPESPAGRRSLCYDPAALQSRKENKPVHSALGLASDMGITLLTEAEYAALQKLGDFDVRTSSWVLTPPHIRAQGGALFGDKRYGRSFIYHNGAESYYAVRGFRGWVEV